MDLLVQPDWLAARLDDPDLVVLDCSVHMAEGPGGVSVASGRPAYEAGHVPGAAHADLTGALRDPDSPLAYALPSPEATASEFGRLGVGDETRVVCYDRSGSGWAARVWWMLRWLGHDAAALLDGGLPAWIAAGHPLSADPPSHPARHLPVRLRPELIAGVADVRRAIADPRAHLLDTMPPPIFSGEVQMYARPGHIASARSVPGMDMLDEEGRFRAEAEIAAGVPTPPGDRTITYCGGGILASAAAFGLTRAGFGNVAVYIGSLEEWAADPANPMETGPPGPGTTPG